MEELWQEIRTYIDLRVKAFKLKATEQMALTMGKLLSLVAFIVMIGFAILLLSIALTIVVSEWVGSLAWAFVIVGGLYALVAVVFLLLRDSLFSNTMVKTFAKMFFPDKTEEEDDDEDDE